MKKIIACIIIGYLLGCISPSYVLSKIKKENFREQGTGNLGATNTMRILGKWYGLGVMLFDIFKAFFAVKLAKTLIPAIPTIWLLSGCAAVVGHIFPFYLKFRGGKGLASFGGVVLAYNLVAFLLLFIISVALMFVFDQAVAMPISAATLFPLFSLNNLWTFLISVLLGGLIIAKNWSNVQKARYGEEIRVSEYITKYMK